MDSNSQRARVQASPPTETVLRRHGLLALAELVDAGEGPALVTLSTGCCNLTLQLRPGPGCHQVEAPTGEGTHSPAIAVPDPFRRPSLRERIQAVLTDQPAKQVSLARRAGHACDSYFREVCAQLQTDGLMVRDQAGGFRRPRAGEEGGAQ